MEVPPFRIEREQGRLWRADEVIPLRRKAWDVLIYLNGRPGELVTKDELLAAVWGGTMVQEAVITNCVCEVRRALGDDRRAPRFIEVVHRRGFRWIGPAGDEEPVATRPGAVLPPVVRPVRRSSCVGRELELQSLRACWDLALNGQRQMVMISGEPGIGKTTLVDHFVASLSARDTISLPLIARGQCTEILGEAEPYLPVLDAIARLCGESRDGALLDILRRCAPTWLAQMPWVLEGEEARAIERTAAGATQDRMLRELSTALEKIAGSQAFILVLEDLHWADRATLDLLAFLAQRERGTRMLVIGTYRPADAIVQRSRVIGLKQELVNQGRAVDISLDHLSEAAVQDYLDHRFASHDFPPSLAVAICRHTDGHPMFIKAVVDELLQRGGLSEREGRWEADASVAKLDLGLPETLKRTLDCQIERLSAEDVRLLEAASAVGIEFSSLELASALERDHEDIEDQCDRLVRQAQFLRDVGFREWPDGSSGERYSFIHGIHQRALYQRLSGGRRSRLHRRIATRLERGFESHPAEVALELAAHFDGAGDIERCARYLIVSGRASLRRASPTAAHWRFTRGLEMATQLPKGPLRLRREVEAWSGIAAALEYSMGLGSAEIVEAFARLEVLIRDLDEEEDGALILEALCSAWGFHASRAEFVRADGIADRLTTIGRSLCGDAGELCAYTTKAATLFMMGELSAADMATQRALQSTANGEEWAEILHYIPRVQALVFGSQTDWLRGNIVHATERITQAGALSRALTHPISEMFVLDNQLLFAVFAGDRAAIAVHSHALSLLCEQYDVPLFAALIRVYRSWASASAGEKSGVADLEAISSMIHSMGFEWGMLGIEWMRADALVRAGLNTEALTVLDGNLARIEATSARYIEAEMYRLRGEALTGNHGSSPDNTAAEHCFRRAIEIARTQDAQWWELRARSSLVRLLGTTSAGITARRELAVLCPFFQEVRDLPPVHEAFLLVGGGQSL